MLDSEFQIIKEKEDKIIRLFNLGKIKEARLVLKGLRAELHGKYLIISLNQIAKRVKNLEIRKQLLKDAVDLDDKDVKSLTAYANALVKNKEFKPALVIFEKVITDYPDNVIALTSYSSALLKDNQFEKAGKILAKPCQKFSHDTKLLTNYAIALVNNQQIPEAFEVFECSLRINDRDTTTLNSYAKALADNGHPKEAFERFEESLVINNKDTTTLTSYAKALADNGHPKEAFERFEESLVINNKDTTTLTSYAKALADNGHPKEAFERFEQSLAVNNKNTTTLNSYAKALADNGYPKEAFERFEESLGVDKKDTTTLTSYAKALADNGHPEKAFERFEQSLAVNKKDTTTLNSYAKALADNGQPEEAFERFEESLAVNKKDTTTLNSYAKALADNGYPEKAFERFEESLAVNNKNTTTLTSYAKALIDNEQLEKALEKIQISNELESNDPITLATYGIILATKGELEAAFKKFEQSLAIHKHLLTFTNYGKFLMQAERFEEAIAQFEQAIQMDSKDHVALFLCANALQRCQRDKEAIEKLEAIDFERLPTGLDKFISLTLIRLCYQTGQIEKADNYINDLINQSDNQDAERLRVAQSLFAVQRHSDKAFAILLEIQEHTPEIQQAISKLIPNFKFTNYFKLFRTDITIKDTEMLNRGMYHKIQNLIAILKDIIYEMIEDTPQDDKLAKILTIILETLTKIKTERHLEQDKIQTIPHDNYQQIIDLISKTAHNIVDFVNNKLSAVREDVLDILEDLPTTAPNYEQLQKLLSYLKATQRALNDLKDVNQGIKLKNRPFKIQDLFALWQKTDKISHAKIRLDIRNPNATFIGDKEKIHSFISELIENSLKHNPEQPKLKITIRSQDSDQTQQNRVKATIRSKNAPQKKYQKYLLITVKDNGKGIPMLQKPKIFLPLITTSQEGTGLGLFMIKRTLDQMHGTILETGEHGALFQIRIPYQDKL
jgi:tetratricopeptide (TPR) repeat protein/two-component sensor histidine kinase